MHVLRSTMLVTTLAMLALGAQLAACGGDDESPAGPSADAGSVDGASTGPTLTVSSSRAKLYLGQLVKIEGASIAPEIASKLAWSVVAAPSGSAITTESIQDAATASPSLKPDRLGLYTLQLSGEKADGAAASVLVMIEAIDAPVFIRDMHLTGNADGSNLAIAFTTQVAGAYGTEAHTVGCPFSAATDAGPGPNIQAFFAAARMSGSNADSWEGPPGTPSRAVFPEALLEPSTATITSRLGVATSSSPCGAPEAKVLETVSAIAGGAPAPTSFIFNTRFSPDGTRIAYMHEVNGRARLSTVGFDGTDKRELTPTAATADGGGLDPDAGTTVRPGGGANVLGPISPRWKDPTHVGWMSFVGAVASGDRPNWELWVVEDRPGATAELAMRCSDADLTHFDFLPDGTIVASVRHTVSVDGGNVKPMDLLVYRANATTKACEIVRNLTNNTTDRALARDFALSPDKSTIAFFAGAGSGVSGTGPVDNVTQLSTVPVDGSRAAAVVPGVTGIGDFGIGPRWAAGGTVITWGQVDLSKASGDPIPLSRLMSVPVGGGNTVVVAGNEIGAVPLSDGGLSFDYHVRFGMGQGCSAAPGAVSSRIMMVFGALGLVGLLARRRRSSTR